VIAWSWKADAFSIWKAKSRSEAYTLFFADVSNPQFQDANQVRWQETHKLPPAQLFLAAIAYEDCRRQCADRGPQVVNREFGKQKRIRRESGRKACPLQDLVIPKPNAAEDSSSPHLRAGLNTCHMRMFNFQVQHTPVRLRARASADSSAAFGFGMASAIVSVGPAGSRYSLRAMA